MGLYIYITSYDRENMREVKNKDVKPVFEDALKLDKSLMISEREYITRGNWFRKEKRVSYFTIYHEQYNDNGNSMYQARQQLSGSGTKEICLAYLFGIINGANKEYDECLHPYAFVQRDGDTEKCTKCGLVLCEG